MMKSNISCGRGGDIVVCTIAGVLATVWEPLRLVVIPGTYSKSWVLYMQSCDRSQDHITVTYLGMGSLPKNIGVQHFPTRQG